VCEPITKILTIFDNAVKRSDGRGRLGGVGGCKSTYGDGVECDKGSGGEFHLCNVDLFDL